MSVTKNASATTDAEERPPSAETNLFLETLKADAVRLPSTYLALGELQRTLVPANLEELHETLLVGSAADDIADEVANVLHASTDLLREYDWKEATVSESSREKALREGCRKTGRTRTPLR